MNLKQVVEKSIFLIEGQWDGSADEGPTTSAEDLNLIPRTHNVGENLLLQGTLWPSHAHCGAFSCTFTCTHSHAHILHTHVYVHTRVHTLTCTYMHTRMYTLTCAHSCTHTCTHMHTHHTYNMKNIFLKQTKLQRKISKIKSSYLREDLFRLLGSFLLQNVGPLLSCLT